MLPTEASRATQGQPFVALSMHLRLTGILHPAWTLEGILIVCLLSCHDDQQGSDASPSTVGSSTSEGPAATDSPTTGGPGICFNSAPLAGGNCAPYGVITAGGRHTCTLLFGGQIRCWGYNDFGELGQGSGTIGDNEVPNTVSPLNLGEAAIQVSAGLHHTCAVTESGRIYCWGSGSAPGLADLNGPAIQVAAGYEHTCALMSDGSVRCWGRGEFGKLGTGNTEDIGDDESLASLAPVDLGARAVQISASENHTCAVLEGGGLICWGLGDRGQLGQGTTKNIGDDETPASVGPIDAGADVKWVATGAFHTCALTVDGEVRCWGSSGNGSLGYGNLTNVGDDEFPSAVGAVSLGRPALGLAAGGATTCALLDNQTLKCWGWNLYGQLGYGNVSDIGSENVPSDFGPIQAGGAVAQVAVGAQHVCALLVDNSIRCWGDGTDGALGYGNIGPAHTKDSPCYVTGPGFVCDLDPVCCVGDMPGEMPPPSVEYQ